VSRVGAVVAALLALFVLHNDLWWWDDPTLVLGLPIGLLYHLSFCLAAAVLMAVASLSLGRHRPEAEPDSEPSP
jgi:hypothetical protein